MAKTLSSNEVLEVLKVSQDKDQPDKIGEGNSEFLQKIFDGSYMQETHGGLV